jgi:hypothetical protein
MVLRMAKLERDPKTGNWRARKVIPADCRAEFGKREEKPVWSARLSEGEARERFGVWLAAVEGRFRSVRGCAEYVRSQAAPVGARLTQALSRPRFVRC